MYDSVMNGFMHHGSVTRYLLPFCFSPILAPSWYILLLLVVALGVGMKDLSCHQISYANIAHMDFDEVNHAEDEYLVVIII